MDGLNALADPTRRTIVEMLAAREMSSGEIARHFTASAPAISQHLKVLREAKLVTVRPEAQRRIYALDPQGWREIEAWLDRMRGFWAKRLDTLEERLKKDQS